MINALPRLLKQSATILTSYLHQADRTALNYHKAGAIDHLSGGQAQEYHSTAWQDQGVIVWDQNQEILEQAGASVAGIIVALDRKEKGQAEHSAIQELAATLAVPVRALVDIDDLISYLADENSQYKDATQLAKMQHYREQYGVQLGTEFDSY